MISAPVKFSRLRSIARSAGMGVLWYHLTHPRRTSRLAYQWLTVPLRPLPDFLIIGANKCGTTSLHNYLNKHPQIKEGLYKEIHFFDRYPRYAEGPNWYRSHFPICTDREEFCVGEATPEYLFHPAVPERVADMIPDVKLIVLVRNPIERAYSHYQHSRRDGSESLSFERALEAEPDRIDGEIEKLKSSSTYYSKTYEHYSYLARGRYMEQIRRWLEHFSREQMMVLRSESLFENPNVVANRVFDFLDLPPHTLNVEHAYNTGDYHSEMDPVIRNKLREYFRPHNEEISKFLDKEIDWN